MLGGNQIAAYAADLLDLEDQIEALQMGKRDLYASIRDEHGKSDANALKRAVKLSRMDADKRDEADAVDTEAQRMLTIIEASRAPRATRSAKTMPDHLSDVRNMVAGTTQDHSISGALATENVELSTTSSARAADPTGKGLNPLSPSEEAPLPVTESPPVESVVKQLADDDLTSPAGAEGDVDRQTIPEPGDGELSETLSTAGEAGTEPSEASTADPLRSNGSAAGQTGGSVASIVPLRRTAADQAREMRPYCLHADDLPKCPGQGRKHCHECLKAHADEVGETT